MGSKNRIAKEIIPIIQKYIDDNIIIKYLEPFVGGANVIDKVICETRIGCDIHRYTIAALKALSNGWSPPEVVTREEYLSIKNNPDNYDDFLVGYVGFNLSFGSKWFGGYVKRCDKKHRGDIYSYKHCIKQQTSLKNILFNHMAFQDIPKEEIKGYVIYCDPPYKGTTTYKTDPFPYEEYYDWVRELSKNNIVLCSEYWMPEDFECIWSKETKANFDSNRISGDENNKRKEKLFTYKSI